MVQSVEFHPAGQLLLTAGLDKRLRLFQVANPDLSCCCSGTDFAGATLLCAHCHSKCSGISSLTACCCVICRLWARLSKVKPQLLALPYCFLTVPHVTAARVVCLQVDGIENPKVQSVYFPDTPLHKAAFANDGAQVSLPPLLYLPVYLVWAHCLCKARGAVNMRSNSFKTDLVSHQVCIFIKSASSSSLHLHQVCFTCMLLSHLYLVMFPSNAMYNTSTSMCSASMQASHLMVLCSDKHVHSLSHLFTVLCKTDSVLKLSHVDCTSGFAKATCPIKTRRQIDIVHRRDTQTVHTN